MPNEYVIKSDGRVFRRPFEIASGQEVEISLDESILANLNVQTSRKFKGVFTSSHKALGPVGVAILEDNMTQYLSCTLSELHLTTTINVDGKTVWPSWSGEGDFVSLVWVPPKGLRLVLMARINYSNGVNHCKDPYLYALDDGGRGFRLPVSNLYDDCRICTGRGDSGYVGPTAQAVFEGFYADFHQTKWGNHLISDDAGRSNTRGLFSFESTPKGFKQSPAPADWKTYCRSVGTDLMRHLAL